MTQNKTDEAVKHIERRFRAFDESDQAAVLRRIEEIAKDYETCGCCNKIIDEQDRDLRVCECGVPLMEAEA